MSDERQKLIDLISSDDPFGLLKEKSSQRKVASNSVLLNNFEEIANFYEENDREPQNSMDDIKEFQLFCRLREIRKNPKMVKQLKDFDMYGLLSGEDVTEVTLEDLVHNDPYSLLDDEWDESVTTLTNVAHKDRLAPDYIARRKYCEDFGNYRAMFQSIHDNMEQGKTKLAIYNPKDLIPGRFYVLGGILVYLKSVDGDVKNYTYESGERERFDGRTECIFDNGTVSNMLYRSLDKALQKDGYSLTTIQESIAAEPDPNDVEYGYIYVLKSHHRQLREMPDVYKIGCTTTSVYERIKNARNESTYLYADVDVIQTFRCFNMSVRKLEDKIHSFFDKVRLNVNIPDESGAIFSPREWFHVNVEVIEEAINLILTNKIDDFVYDPTVRQIIRKHI